MSSMPEFPKCVAFRSEQNGSYLRYVHGSNKAAFLEPSGEDCISPYTRFYLEPSEHDGLVHIRCCYNNTYWVVAQEQPLGEEGGGWIIGTADEPEDDLSKPSCTLFKLIPMDPVTEDSRHSSIRFFHAHLGKHASMFSSSDMTNQAANCSLRVGHDGTAGEDNGCNAFKLLYLDKQLPKYVAFKADNGMYLSAQLNENYNYLAFSSDDIGDPTVMNTMFSNEEDGTIRIKSNRFGRFWRRSPSYPYWIWADSTDTAYGDNRDTVFEVIKVGDYFALRNMGNNLFCKRYTDLGMTNCLSAKIETIQIFAKLRLEETVLSREIKVKDIDFHLSRARIYDRRVLVMDSASASNGGSKDNIIKLTLKYTETEKSTWDATASWKLGVTTKIKAGIPMLVDGAVEVSNEFTGSYNWGSTIEKTTSQEVEYQVTVPPRTKVTVRLIASQGSCDVPFSYEQRDILVDGQDLTQNLEDGIYTGINCYDFRYEVEEEKM